MIPKSGYRFSEKIMLQEEVGAPMTPSLARRIAVTIGLLLLFRLGEFIPLPGVNANAWAMLARGEGSGVTEEIVDRLLDQRRIRFDVNAIQHL